MVKIQTRSQTPPRQLKRKQAQHTPPRGANWAAGALRVLQKEKIPKVELTAHSEFDSFDGKQANTNRIPDKVEETLNEIRCRVGLIEENISNLRSGLTSWCEAQFRGTAPVQNMSQQSYLETPSHEQYLDPAAAEFVPMAVSQERHAMLNEDLRQECFRLAQDNCLLRTENEQLAASMETSIPLDKIDTLLQANADKTAEQTAAKLEAAMAEVVMQKEITIIELRAELQASRHEHVPRENMDEATRLRKMNDDLGCLLNQANEKVTSQQTRILQLEQTIGHEKFATSSGNADHSKIDILYVSHRALSRLDQAVRDGDVMRKVSTWKMLSAPEFCTISDTHDMEAINVGHIPQLLGVSELVKAVGHDLAARLLLQGRQPALTANQPAMMSWKDYSDFLNGLRESDSDHEEDEEEEVEEYHEEDEQEDEGEEHDSECD